jgi:hypothetical protein
VLLRLAVGGHAALAGDAAPERHPGQPAGEIIGPVVIDAGDLLRRAALREAQQRTAMGAAVLEGMDGAVVVAGDHHRHVAEIGEPERIRLRQLGFQAQEGPGIAAEDALLLLRIEVAVGVEPVGNAGEPFRRPWAPARMDVHDAAPYSMIPKSCRLFGQDHAQDQRLQGVIRFNLKR